MRKYAKRFFAAIIGFTGLFAQMRSLRISGSAASITLLLKSIPNTYEHLDDEESKQIQALHFFHRKAYVEH